MKPLIVLLLLPVLFGVASHLLFRGIRSASFAATISSLLAVGLCLRVLDPDGTWSWLAALLIAPLVVAEAVTTVLVCFGRSRARKRAA